MSKAAPRSVMCFLENLGLFGDPAGYSERDILLAYERKCRATQHGTWQVGHVDAENEHARAYAVWLSDKKDEFLKWRRGRLVESTDEWCGIWGERSAPSGEQGRPMDWTDSSRAGSASGTRRCTLRNSATATMRPRPSTAWKTRSAGENRSDGDEGSDVDTPCPDAPHCDTWDAVERYLHRKHYGPAKRNEYLFLYAAEQMCAHCMRHYIEVEGVDPACQSAGKSARDYAMATARKHEVPLAVDVHNLLARHGV